MRILIASILLFIINFTAFSQTEKNFEIKKISFDVEPVIEINDCIKWHVDFRELKSTVVFKDHLISMGLYGGMVAIDTNLTQVNKSYSEKLNSDLYTNLTVRHDTLFSEKFNQIYFLNLSDTTWKPYTLNEPVALFDILFEDGKFVFYSISQGEWGTVLFVYDKEIKALRAISYQTDPKCIFFKDGHYYINASLRHGSGSSSFKSIANVKTLPIVSTQQNKKLLLSHFNKLPIVDYPKVNLDAIRKDDLFKNLINIDYGIMVTNTFHVRNREFHFTDYNQWKDQSQSYDKTYITEIDNRELKIVDSINSFSVLRTRNFNDIAIIESKFINKGIYISKGDKLYFLNYKGTPEHDFGTNYSTTKYVKGEVIPNRIYFFRTVENNTFNYTVSPDTAIIAEGARDPKKLYFKVNDVTRNIKLLSSDNILYKACLFKGNTLLYFKNLGNADHKYSLIEIYNMDRFINEYSK
jgi:hypothetical protein